MIRRAEAAADFELCARIKSTVEPGQPITAGEIREDSLRASADPRRGRVRDREGVEPRRLRVHDGSRAARGAAAGRRLGAPGRVLGRGAGARQGLALRARGGRRSRVPWLGRAPRLRGDLAGGRADPRARRRAAPEPPAGIALAEFRPEHLEGVYAVAVDATPDLAVGGGHRGGAVRRWLAEMEGRILVVALEGEQVVGFATLVPLAGQARHARARADGRPAQPSPAGDRRGAQARADPLGRRHTATSG